MEKEKVILVDEDGHEIGSMEKIKAHREGRLHRAFSIYVFNSEGKLLLQKRAKKKYHSGGLWTNTCCSHPRPQESIEKAAQRRLQEEMGFDCDLRESFSFTYKVKLDNDLFEHEHDHVFIGEFDGEPVPNPEEVEDWKWIGLEELQKDVRERPDRYTYWLRICINRFISASCEATSSSGPSTRSTGVLQTQNVRFTQREHGEPSALRESFPGLPDSVKRTDG
ncbi:MAG: isopentenyl-diphosphate Delta-isomerase [Candidatus Binatia bacterium]